MVAHTHTHMNTYGTERRRFGERGLITVGILVELGTIPVAGEEEDTEHSGL